MEKIKEKWEQVLFYWFGCLDDDPEFFPEKQALDWFTKNQETERYITDTFTDLMNKAEKGELSQWEESPRGRLCLILLLDQFPRKIFHGSAKAFSFDSIALKHTMATISSGHDKLLLPIERAFAYLPLQHAELQSMQNWSVTKFHSLSDIAPDKHKAKYDEFLNNAIVERNTIVKFGRFPERNDILGRASTPEEIEFLNSFRNR
ncbi:MAG: hypothetical protein ACI9S8_002386 [Chlamydiales bacterium]|jgi:uncharacterized protein (DUF924 family)